jgi:hypothetical protein
MPGPDFIDFNDLLNGFGLIGFIDNDGLNIELCVSQEDKT